jgi:hypothetical protein
MAYFVPIVSRSGTGKSTSGRNLNPETTYWANCDNKPLPFPKAREKYNEEKGNYITGSNPAEIINFLKAAHKKTEIKEVIIDTMSHIMVNYVMNAGFRADSGFKKWANLSGSIFDIMDIINTKMRDDIIVYCMFHPTEGTNDEGFTMRKIATQGQQLDKMSIESFASVVLFSKVDKIPGQKAKYMFETQTDGVSTAKSPMGMFEEETIENDLVLVSKKIREYTGI